MKKVLILALIIFLFSFCFVFAAFQIQNPLSFSTFDELVAKLIGWVKMMAFAIVGLVIVWAGFSYATAGGDPQKIETAKRMLLYAVIGLAVILLAESILKTIQGILDIKTT